MRRLNLVGTIVCIVGLALLTLPAGGQAAGAGPFVIVSTVSYHTRETQEMNDNNPGAGLGFAFNRHFEVIAGAYENSVYERSRYAMARVRLLGYRRSFAIHLAGGYLDGYASYLGPRNVGAALDVQIGKVAIVAAPDGINKGAVLSLWFLLGK